MTNRFEKKVQRGTPSLPAPLSVLSQIQNITFFLVLFIFFSLPFLRPVLVTGAAEGSPSVKEAHGGLMRTVLAS